MLDRDSVLALIRRYPDTALVRRFEEFIAAHPDSYVDRANTAGHLTASAWVTDETGEHALLLHHAKLGIWVQPGGHVEPEDETLLAGALREAREETGIEDFTIPTTEVLSLDIHTIPERGDMPAHPHYDLRFHLVARYADFREADSLETRGGEWRRIVDIIADPATQPATLDMARKTLVNSLAPSSSRDLEDSHSTV